MRMQIRRLTRLTKGFSRKRENLWAALCLHFAYSNFCRVHKSLRVTPAMQAGITDAFGTFANYSSGEHSRFFSRQRVVDTRFWIV